MVEGIDKPRLVRIAELLQRHRVEFLVIGGTAAVLLGSPLTTFDVDLCYLRDRTNLERLAKALSEIHPTLRGAPADLPFRLDAESLALGANFTFETDVGPLDLLGYVEPLGLYEDLLPRSEEMDLGTCRVKVIGLDDLIAIKRHLGRPKDRNALVQLEELKRLRDQGPET
jgi:predicted nucleotidyltransferase